MKNCKNCDLFLSCLRSGEVVVDGKEGSFCESWTEKREPRMTPYERTRAAVYATGNRWAIENFHATHD